MEDESAFLYKSFLLFVGASLVIFGIMLIGLSQSSLPEGGNLIIVVGPFLIAIGKDVSPLTALIVVGLSIAILLAFIFLLKRYLGELK